MRFMAVTLVAAMLAGCAHAGEQSGSGSERHIVRVAQRAALRDHLSTADLLASVSDRGDVWQVRFTPRDPKVLDGGVWVEVSKKTGRALRVWADS